MYKVFTYGTLRSGQQNHHLIRDSKFEGHFDTGPGYTKIPGPGFPFLLKDPEGEGVIGEVYSVTRLKLAMLDRLEGHPDFYVRELITVHGMDGPIKAYVYLMPIERLT